MELTPEQSSHPTRIVRFEPGKLWCACGTYEHSVVITAEAIMPFAPSTFAELKPADLAAVVTPDTELLLLGTGPTQNQPLNRDFLAPLQATGVPFEAMTTPSACRTFELLVSDGRRVMAVLLLNEG